MKDVISILGSYLKQNVKSIVIFFITFGIFLMVFTLYSIPLEPAGYAALLTSVVIFIIAFIDFLAFYKKHLTLKSLRNHIVISELMFPSAKDLIERDYQELIMIIDRNRSDLINTKDKDFKDMLEYYTIWAHQIKTPIAAMRLLLQSEKSNLNNELLDQLFRIEQYVEMVLQYLRLESINTDLMFERYSLDDIVKQGIRKYSKSFILKKIKLNYENLNHYVLTDEKWLVFVVEQVLSNALKYTKKGEISIYMDCDLPNTLVIEDTGIGIEQEDLPRVFEKGFTGYNGRADKKSTGIGLYLCKQILDKLSHTLSIESKAGQGTKVKIGLDVTDILVE